MALRLNEKLLKMMLFLKATSHPLIFSLLSTRGFTPKIRQQGFNLLARAMGGHFDLEELPEAGLKNINEILAQLDDWENTWYPVIRASLKYEFPAIYAEVFQNISQTRGMELLFTVATVLDRSERLEQGTEEEQKAFAKLESRGLTQEVRQQARGLIHEGKQTPEEENATPIEVDEEETKVAEEAMWNWYREWAEIARSVIHRKDYLISLGLRKPRKETSTPSENDD